MSRRCSLCVMFAIGCLFVLTSESPAQRRGAGTRANQYQGRRPEVPKQNTRAEGVIQGIKGNILHVVSEKGDQWLVKAPDKAQNVTVKGSALQSWLARGMWVRFVGTFDKRGVVQAPINEVFVFTPGQPGSERNAENYKPGIYAEGAATTGLKGIFADEGARKPVVEVADFRVVGRLNGISNGMMAVSAGRKGVKAPLAEDARISANVSDLRLIRVGDKVDVSGWHLPNQKGRIFAERMTVTPAVPLGTPIEKPEGGKKAEE